MEQRGFFGARLPPHGTDALLPRDPGVLEALPRLLRQQGRDPRVVEDLLQKMKQKLRTTEHHSRGIGMQRLRGVEQGGVPLKLHTFVTKN